MANINYFLKDKNRENTSIIAIVRNKGERFKIATGAEESDSVYLSEGELKRIIDFVPSLDNIHHFTEETRSHNLQRSIEMLNNVKSRFLIGCYTALRVSDFKRIDTSKLRDGFHNNQ